MPVGVPIHNLPRNMVSCTVYGGNSDAVGDITWSTGVDLGSKSGTAAYDNFKVGPKMVSAKVDPSDSTAVINIPSQTDLSFTITELQASDGSTAIQAIANSYDYIKVVQLYRPRGATTGGTYRAAMGMISEVDADLVNQTGKNIYTVNAINSFVGGYFEGSTLPTNFTS